MRKILDFCSIWRVLYGVEQDSSRNFYAFWRWGKIFEMFRKSQPNAFKNLRNASQSTRWTLKNALHTFKSVPVYAEKLQNIRNLIQSEGGRYGLDAHDVRTDVKQFDLGPDEIRGFSSRIVYNLRSDTNSQENIYDANRNERFLYGDDDF